MATNTQVFGGTLNVASSGSFSTAGTLTLDSGGSITGGPITAAAYQFNSGTASAKLSGPGVLVEDTNGVLTLTGVNTYTGGTLVEAGELIVGTQTALPRGGSLIVGSNPVSQLLGRSPALSNVSLAGSAAIVMSPAAAPVTSATAATSETAAPIVTAGPPANTPAKAASAFRPRVVFPSVTPAKVSTANLSTAASDAVFASHRSGSDTITVPANLAQSASCVGMAEPMESGWNSSAQNQKNDSKAAALDEVLARFGV